MTQSEKVFSLTGDFKRNPKNQEYLMTPQKTRQKQKKLKRQKAQDLRIWYQIKIRRKTIGKRTFADHLLRTNH